MPIGCACWSRDRSGLRVCAWRDIAPLTVLLLAAWCASTTVLHAADTLVVVAGVESGRQADIAARSKRAGLDVATLDAAVLASGTRLIAEIEQGDILEVGVQRPAHLDAFSDAVMAALPQLAAYRRIHVVSPIMLPIELAVAHGNFVGDGAVVSHEFFTGAKPVPLPTGKRLPFGSYVIEAVMGMPTGMARADQDIVQVALALEQQLPVELHFDSGREGLQRALARRDIGILHIDTHGGEGGVAIQVARHGALLFAAALPARVHIPVVMLFGCEGVASSKSFGSVMRDRGAEAVISSFAKFQSFGMTGEAAREKRVYEAFFGAVQAGEDIGTAVLRMRQAALEEAVATGSRRTLTRLFFVLLGNSQLSLQVPVAN